MDRQKAAAFLREQAARFEAGELEVMLCVLAPGEGPATVGIVIDVDRPELLERALGKASAKLADLSCAQPDQRAQAA